MHQQGSLMPPLHIFCQCRSSETPSGVDPDGGCAYSENAKTTVRQPVSRWHPDSGYASHHCDICGGSEQEHRFKVLFQVLDVNGDGGICVNDLTIGLKKLGVHRTERELMVGEHLRCVTSYLLSGYFFKLIHDSCLSWIQNYVKQ